MAAKTVHEAVFKISGQTDKSLSSAFKAAEQAAGSVGGKVAGSLKNAGAAIGKATLAMGASVAGAAIAAGKALIDLGTDFDKASDAIRIGTGATGEALEALNADFDAVYSSVPTTMEDASTAIAEYNTRLGLTGEPLQQLSEQAIQVSNLLGEDLNSVIEESSQAFQQWDIDADEMGDAMDYVFKASQATGTGFTDLMSDVQQFGPQMQDLGFSFEETTALLGQLDKAGVNSSEVMGALKKSVTTMAKDGMSASEGLEYYTQAIKDAGSAQEATAIASEIFGSRAGSTMAAAIRDGSLSVEDLTKSLQESDETIMKAAEDTASFPEKLQLLKQKAQVALKPVANSMFEQIEKALPFIEQIFEKAMPILEELGGRLSSAFETVMPVVMDVLTQVADQIMLILPQILDAFEQVWGYIQPALEQVMGVLADSLMPLFEQLSPYIDEIIEQVMGIYEALAPLMADILSAVIPVIADVASTVLPNVMNAISGVLDIIKNVIDFIQNVFTGDWEAAWQNIKDIVEGIFSTFADVIKVPINAAITVINHAIQAINGALGEITIPDWVPIFGGKSFKFSIPEIPLLARGGTITSPTLAMIGEAGPETVVPHNNTPRSRALLQEAARGVYGNTSHNTYNVTFAPVISGDNAGEIAELTMQKFKAFMAQYERDNLREAWT